MSNNERLSIQAQVSLLTECSNKLGGVLGLESLEALNVWHLQFYSTQIASGTSVFVDELIGAPVAEWEERIARHKANHHPWYDYIAQGIGIDEMASFLLENRYYPTFIELLKKIKGIQFIGDAREAVEENIEDEFHPAPHAELMKRMMLAVKARASVPIAIDIYPSLIDRTLVFYYGYFVQPWHLVGSLFATEHMGTHRVISMRTGLSRMGLSDEELEFTVVHSECDEHHADDWMARVIIPSINNDPELLPVIATGIAECLDSSARYLDYLLDRAKSIAPVKV